MQKFLRLGLATGLVLIVAACAGVPLGQIQDRRVGPGEPPPVPPPPAASGR